MLQLKNSTPFQGTIYVVPDAEGLDHALYMRDTVVPAMDRVREVADRLERIVADDLWPLPKYSEMLFIK